MHLRSPLRRLGAALTLLLATACGGGGGATGSATADDGAVTVTLSDASSSTLGVFEVDVRGIVFERRGGGIVTLAPRASRVDFAQMDGLDDLVATTSLPAGNYVRAALTLDFTSARVLIAGASVPATVRDPQGAAITGPIEVDVDFGADDRLVVTRGRRHLFAFDLDLDQSVTVDSVANVVTFAPVLNLTVDPSEGRPIGSTGRLRSVDTNTSSFVVERLAGDGTVLDTFTVTTGGSTIFQVNGVPQVGALGLGSLVGNLGQRVFVQGDYDRVRSRVDARVVEAGAGVIGNGQDHVIGHVVARATGAGFDAQLTVRGRSIDYTTGTRRYDTAITVDTSRGFTKVLRRGSATAFGTDDVAVGQAVVVFGDLTGTTLDAVNGIVRMTPTAVVGAAAGPASAGTLTLAVTHIDRRPVAQFNFTVAGIVETDPAAFRLDVAALATAGIVANTRVEAFAWFRGIGSTGADADAIGLVARGSSKQLLFCHWSPASSGALTAASPTALTLDLAGSDVGFVRERSLGTTLTATPAPTIVGTGGNGHYRIVRDRAVASFRDFALFRAEVLARVATQPVVAVSGRGSFDPATQSLAARDVTVVLR